MRTYVREWGTRRAIAELNSDLLLTAALTHDLGRTREFTRGAEIGLTEEGRLLGHLLTGERLLSERAGALDENDGWHCAASAPGGRFASAEALALYRHNALDAGVRAHSSTASRRPRAPGYALELSAQRLWRDCVAPPARGWVPGGRGCFLVPHTGHKTTHVRNAGQRNRRRPGDTAATRPRAGSSRPRTPISHHAAAPSYFPRINPVGR